MHIISYKKVRVLFRPRDEKDSDIPEPEGTPAGCMKYLMEEHGLMPSDLHEIGDENVVAEILSGNRQLDISQIRLLSKRFRISPAVFVS